MFMTDIAVIILVGQEKLHIRRCLERLRPLNPRQIFVVDCFSTDGTQRIVKQYSSEIGSCGDEEFRKRAVAKVEEWLDGVSEEISPPPKHYRPLTEVVETVAKHQAAGFSPSTTESSVTYLAGKRKGACPIISLVEHEWPGNQAAQFQWALDNLPIDAKWILRLDADEYLTDELIAEIKEKLSKIEDGVDGVVLKRRHVVGWLNDRWIKRGMYPARILRLFRRGHGRSDLKIMDEHIVVDGKVIEFDNDFVDHSLISFEDWKAKHRGYARREAQSYLSGERSTGEKAARKDAYYKLPPYFRAFAYFCYRYFLRLGFLDGYAGWMWHFYQGLWYRCLVDREISKLPPPPPLTPIPFWENRSDLFSQNEN